MKKEFKPESRKYEILLLQKNDPEFKELKKYLEPYIKDILAHFSMTQKTYNILYKQLMDDIPVAAEHFLNGKSMDADYKFSTYFGWYISERLNNCKEEIERIK